MKTPKTFIQPNNTAVAQPTAVIPQDATQADTQPEPAPALYDGIPYTAIIERLLANWGVYGAPAEGNRNTILYKCARTLRYICDFNAQRLLSILPDWGLPEAERLGTIQSAVVSARGTEMPAELHTIIARLHGSGEEDEAPKSDEALPIPRALPALLRCIVQDNPGNERAALLASLPCLGALLTNLRAPYLDGQMHSPIFMSCIVAPQASGKSFTRKLVDLMLAPINEADALARSVEQEYRNKLKATKNTKQQPEEPDVVVRSLTPNVSNAVLLKRMDKAKGLSLFTFAEELDTLTRGNKAGAWSEKSDIYRMAFDGAEWGQDYMSENSYSAKVQMRYNLLLCGTPLAMNRFFKNVEDGLTSRFLFAELEDNRGCNIVERPKRLNDARITEICRTLHADGSNEDALPLYIKLPKTLQAINRWTEERIAEYLQNPDNVALDTYRRRSAVIGFRAAMIAYWLEGRRETKSVIDFAIWVASEALRHQLNLFGYKLNVLEQEVLASREDAQRINAAAHLLDQLPEEFSIGDLQAIRSRAGMRSRPNYIITRWMRQGLITKAGNSYKKTSHG